MRAGTAVVWVILGALNLVLSGASADTVKTSVCDILSKPEVFHERRVAFEGLVQLAGSEYRGFVDIRCKQYKLLWIYDAPHGNGQNLRALSTAVDKATAMNQKMTFDSGADSQEWVAYAMITGMFHNNENPGRPRFLLENAENIRIERIPRWYKTIRHK
ncbi:hypothetical protein FHS83_002817 [Rhizomicrobium palustre]|uniref:Uncharacterized protein n=1 Tax=Rhizomicrobium palustre TaxID=189966 RepID=A0A846N1Y0_9PROT|nr:hypothetical protein [Rhizomicrobium palustre]NIK89499.1 hypothetical protein [Rhizomicrobium palustre]